MSQKIIKRCQNTFRNAVLERLRVESGVKKMSAESYDKLRGIACGFVYFILKNAYSIREKKNKYDLIKVVSDDYDYNFLSLWKNCPSCNIVPVNSFDHMCDYIMGKIKKDHEIVKFSKKSRMFLKKLVEYYLINLLKNAYKKTMKDKRSILEDYDIQDTREDERDRGIKYRFRHLK